MEYMLVSIGVTLQILPCAFLCIYPFRQYAQITAGKVIGLICVYFAFLVFITLVIMVSSFEFVIIPIYLLLVASFFMYRAVIKIRLTKQLYIYFAVGIFGLLSAGITNYLEAVFFPHNYYVFYSRDYILTNLLVMLMIIPWVGMFLFIKVKPAIAGNDAAYWKYMWSVPAVILVVLGAFIGVQELWHIESWQYITVLLLLGMLSFVICYISIEMMVQADRNAGIQAEKESLERLALMKSEMAASISHETRTPLAVLSGYAELISMELREQGVNEQTVRDLNKISVETRRIADMMEQMQKLTMKNYAETEKVPLDMGDIIKQTARLYIPILERKNVLLKMDIPENLPNVFANAEELTQVLFNLLQNAKKHIETGSITITVNLIDDSQMRVSITDTGSGIDPQLLDRVFERGVSGSEGGSGIGLALCKEIIASHGGTISARNTEDGAEVTFTLPIPAQ